MHHLHKQAHSTIAIRDQKLERKRRRKISPATYIIARLTFTASVVYASQYEKHAAIFIG